VNKAKISVVIPTFCSEVTIERCVLSIVNQSLQPSEIIIVDDASTDGTINTIAKIKENFQFNKIGININCIFLEKNNGPGTARNIGWNAAIFDYVAFLDSDDTWHPKKIEIQYNYMINNDYIDMICALSVNFNNEKNANIECSQFKIRRLNFISQLISNKVVTSSVILKKNISERFKDGKKYSEDNLLWLEILRANYSIYRIDKIVTYSYKGPYGSGGLTGSLVNMWFGQIDAYWTLYKNKKVNFILLFFILVISTFKYIVRHLFFILRVK
jgi:teichuronic acid biosynthesis glycosyltransferase TuaG